MIYTSYFANMKNIDFEKKNLKPMCIALYPPAWYRNSGYKSCSYLAPSKELLDDYKNERIDEDEYEVRYKQQLNNLWKTPDEIYEELDGCVLLCYETSDAFCHRHILANWLNSKISKKKDKVLEYRKVIPKDSKKYKKVKKAES